MKISLIIPCYNEEMALPALYTSLKNVMEQLSEYQFELLFVDDGSSDATLKILKAFSAENPYVTYLSFSRNFGKEAAMYAGFCNVTGDFIAIIDADMQDPPELLPEMIEIIQSGYDSVATRRVSRQGEPIIRSLFAKLFYKIMNRISESDIVDGARDFRLMKRSMVDSIIAISEYNRFSKGIFGWLGFKTYWLPYENRERVAGETKWNFWKLFKYSLDGIINFSQIPLSLASWTGIGFTFFSFVMIVFVIVRKIVWGDKVAGWPSLICVITFLGGIQLLCLGIIGQYLSKTYLETKKRPHYIVKETNQETVKKVN